MFKNKRKFKNTFAPSSENDSCLDIVSPSSGSVIEVSTFWKERLLQVYSFPKKGSVYLSNKKDGANFVIAPKEYSAKNKARLLKITNKAVECYPVKSTFSYYSKKGEVPYSALVESSQIVQKSKQTCIILKQGELVRLHSKSSDFQITISYKKPSSSAKAGALISMSLSELSVLALSFVALLFLFLYNTAIEEKAAKTPLEVKKFVSVSFKKNKPTLIKKTVVDSGINKPKKSTAKKKNPKKRIVVKSKPSVVKHKKVSKKGTAFKIKKGKTKASVLGRKSGGLRKKKVDVKSVGILGVFAKSGKQKKIAKLGAGSGGLYGLARSKVKGSGAGNSSDRLATRFGSGLKRSKGGSPNSTVKLGSGIGTYGSPNGLSGGSIDLGSPSKVSISYAGDVGDDFVGGGVDSAGIYRVIQAHKNVIRFCYQKEQDYYPSLGGLVSLYWKINSKGRVVNANIKKLSSSKMRGVGNCIVKNLRSWIFPKTPKGSFQAVEFPFRFKGK
ncbi:MAG: AgmX/PglI C-terminal domain-containing protein [Bdellovibrionaceae bacterium]|nr:AgmX/PglI C-terminal domain-containing protein [Pseudobdellovibrionaceae bacterium]